MCRVCGAYGTSVPMSFAVRRGRVVPCNHCRQSADHPMVALWMGDDSHAAYG